MTFELVIWEKVAYLATDERRAAAFEPLRRPTRLGYGKEAKSYSATYRSVTDAASPELEGDIDRMIEANLLLRHHGQTICKTTRPRCSECSLHTRCPSAAR